MATGRVTRVRSVAGAAKSGATLAATATLTAAGRVGVSSGASLAGTATITAAASVTSVAPPAFPAPRPSFVKTLQNSHRAPVRLELWRNGVQVATNAPFIDGEVTATRVTGTRRTISLMVPPTAQWQQLISTPGLELRPYRGLNYGSGALDMYPLGRFYVMAGSIDSDPGTPISISADDHWTRIVGDQFPFPRASASGLIRNMIATLIRESEIGEPVVTATSTAAVQPVVWDSDRSQAIGDLCTAINAEAFVDRSGVPTVQDRAGVSGGGYVLADGEGGTRINLVTTVDWTTVFNEVSIRSTTTDPALVFASQKVSITDPSSPAYSLNIGRRVFPYESAQIISSAQALAVIKTLLSVKAAPARQLSITCVPNVQLSEGDSIAVAYRDGSTEDAQIQTITYPLTADGAQKITTVTPSQEVT